MTDHTNRTALPAVRRRRCAGDAPLERATLRLRSDVLSAAKQVVQAGGAVSLGAFVEAAVEEKLRRVRRAALYAAYDEASRDPDFGEDLSATTRAFAAADADGLWPEPG